MVTMRLSFYEVEHEGDLDPILGDIQRSGGHVVSTAINDEAEIARVVIEVEDKAAFREKFLKTDSAGWIN